MTYYVNSVSLLQKNEFQSNELTVTSLFFKVPIIQN